MKLASVKNSERGNSMVEFALVAPFWIAVLFGTVAVGTNLTRTIQVVQSSRDLGNMYAKGTDFSATASQYLITGDGGSSASLVQGMQLSVPSVASDNAVVIFSQVRHVYSTDADCTSGTCANANKDVFVNRIIIGKSSLQTSVLGNPDSTDLNSQGNTQHPTSDTTDQTNQFNLFPVAGGFTLASTEVAYVVEVYMSSPDLAFLAMNGLGYGLGGSTGNYSRAVF